MFVTLLRGIFHENELCFLLPIYLLTLLTRNVQLYAICQTYFQDEGCIILA